MDNEKLASLVEDYQTVHGPLLDSYLVAFTNFEWPGRVIYDAVHGRNGEIHSHQWRLRFRPEVLEQACSTLTRRADGIKLCKSFARLLDAVEDATHGVDHFRELAVYDTSLRIGAHLGLWPKVVYLHAGTRLGYEALVGVTTTSHMVDMDDLPRPVQVLAAHHAENFLCIYKDCFTGGRVAPKPCFPPAPKRPC